MSLAVVGDTLLDIDLTGSVTRLCPDAPVPVLDLESELARPGGAGLAATIAASGGLDVRLVTAIADDTDGDRLRKVLGDMPVVAGPSWTATPVKTRLRAAGQSLVRVDRGGDHGDPVVTDEMLDAVQIADAVLVSDYGRGIAQDKRLRDLLSQIANRTPIVWDPHPRGPDPVRGTRMVTPNAAEATAASDSTDPCQAAELLRARWRAEAVVITMGSRGALLKCAGDPVTIPAPRTLVADPCGAGDCFAATVAVRLMSGAGSEDAVRSGVDAASRFLAGGGAAAIDEQTLREGDQP
ncbi:rfaE bifunctional protein kinase chain/domain [Kibdelosporangium banguiense]|uniref:RfaE bifunctional protein kinase chain/domain n=1 Tax=Kibdelosporangium banguiense TaxID=1365924 RepID=A0ABS4U396_9PSEU|nr:PfkB family carbohydrate kinase [Kibdelosporangium banguiense]MBP2330669.1 rfaE bifunctional protein kinase chain/domain [Kibdelosporangium banguiense]